MSIPLRIKELIWPPWAERCRRNAGWEINHRVICYLFGEVAACFDLEVRRGYIAAARLVNSKMKELA